MVDNKERTRCLAFPDVCPVPTQSRSTLKLSPMTVLYQLLSDGTEISSFDYLQRDAGVAAEP